jgi:hypothetical protein
VKFSVASLIWLAAYVAVMALVVGGLLYGRSQAIAVYGSGEAQQQWDTWRDDAKEMAAGAGPVKRREPKSAEPPALVLMRDHFLACAALAVLLSSVLFATFMFFLRGALQSRSPTLSATSGGMESARSAGPDGAGGLL